MFCSEQRQSEGENTVVQVDSAALIATLDQMNPRFDKLEDRTRCEKEIDQFQSLVDQIISINEEDQDQMIRVIKFQIYNSV